MGHDIAQIIDGGSVFAILSSHQVAQLVVAREHLKIIQDIQFCKKLKKKIKKNGFTFRVLTLLPRYHTALPRLSQS